MTPFRFRVVPYKPRFHNEILSATDCLLKYPKQNGG